MDPITLALAAAATQAVGQISQGNAANNAAKHNAQMLTQQAAMTRDQGLAKEELQRQQARQVIGQQNAAGAESGVALAGSRLDVLNKSMYDAEMDALNIRYDRETNATGMLDQAAMARFEGKQRRNQGYLNAAGTLLGASAKGGYGAPQTKVGT